MRLSSLLSRIARHVFALLMAFALGGLALTLCVPLAAALMSFVSTLFALSICASAAAAGWMVGGLTANRKDVESGLVIFAEGAALALWKLSMLEWEGVGLEGLVPIHCACFGAALAAWFVLRPKRKAQVRFVAFASAIAAVVTLALLQISIPGRRCEFEMGDGVSEFVSYAQPLTEDWKDSHGAHEISHSQDAIYVWRSSENANRLGAETDSMCGTAWWGPDGPCYTLTKLSDPAEIDAAYEALWETEKWLIDWRIKRCQLPFYLRYLHLLRGEWRRGSVWRAEPYGSTE